MLWILFIILQLVNKNLYGRIKILDKMKNFLLILIPLAVMVIGVKSEQNAGIAFIMKLIPPSMNLNERQKILFSYSLYKAYLAEKMSQSINFTKTTTKSFISDSFYNKKTLVSHYLMRFWIILNNLNKKAILLILGPIIIVHSLTISKGRM